MKIHLETANRSCAADLNAGKSIAIVLDFDGEQPNHFGVQSASRIPVQAGDFVGSVRQGGGCNVDLVKLIPHCNGTHTESVGHIVQELVPVAGLAMQSFFLAELITVRPSSDRRGDSYIPELRDGDSLITASVMKSAMQNIGSKSYDALIIRTLPNDPGKRTRAYGQELDPAFLTSEAMQLVVEQGVDHLLVDLPSVDRMYDEGRLSNHHLFWNIEQGRHHLAGDAWSHKTITEMIFVPDELPDGSYVLNLQIAPFSCDAAPSRPILYPCNDQKK